MDRNVVTATVLIALIMVVWLTFLTPPQPPEDISDAAQTEVEPELVPEAPRERVLPLSVSVDSTVMGAADGDVREITVRTDLYEATLSTRGATLTSIILSKYQPASGMGQVELIDSLAGGALALVFTSPNNRVYDTRAFVFETDAKSDLIMVGDSSVTLSFWTNVGDGTLRQQFRFSPKTYEIGLDVTQQNAESYSTREGYEVVWSGAIPFAEADRQNETTRSGAYARSGGEVEGVQVSGETYAEQSLRGDVSWVAVKTAYFMVAVMPDGKPRAAELIGERIGEVEDPNLHLAFFASLTMPQASGEADSFRIYAGPMEFNRINRYGLDLYDTVDYGWDFFEVVTRPLAKFVFIPAFSLLGSILPNFGLVIIVFSILIKLLLYPLTKKSFTSMAKMRELQPKMEAIKEKYADNPQKQQEATMRMYKETGVNPLGGCMPMLLQYPIIIALWQYLPQSIQIRQQGFLWAADLSAPDVIFNLPFTVPLYGNFVAGFTLLMGVSMIFQMRLQSTPTTNPQAKMFMYIMPVMIPVIFNKLAAGLNLYYLCYNVLTAGQQLLINRSIDKQKQLEEEVPRVRKFENKPKKERRRKKS